MNQPSLILLRSDEPHQEALERLLHREFAVVAVVIEPGAAQLRSLRRRGRMSACRWRVYHAWRRAICGSAGLRRRFFAGLWQDGTTAPSRIKVENINDPAVLAVLREQPHDYVIVIGTSILQRSTLAASAAPFINIHGGCLPDFRGNHCVFFAYMEGRPECFAATIHLVDEGVDTGGILAVCRAETGDAPLWAGPEYFYCGAELNAFTTLVQILRAGATAPLRAQAQPTGRKAFLTNDRKPQHELLFIWKHLGSVFRRSVARLKLR
jgi:hypothetical protein